MISIKEENKCKECNKDRFIVNKTYGLCSECNYKRLHGGKSIFEVNIQKQKDKPLKPLKSTPIKVNPRKKTGEWEMFMEIWAERTHYCVNRSCGKFLGEEPKAIYFSHRKSKGAYPSLRLEKSNIDLLCTECHYQYDHGSRSKIIL